MIESPHAYVLLLLLLMPAFAIWRFRRRRRDAVPLNISISHQADRLSWTWRRQTAWVVPTLRMLGLSALIIAAARPFDWRASSRVDSQGIAIELVVDRSGSMRADDYELDGQRVSRLEAVVDAAGRFIVGDPMTGSRGQDLIGLITFARQADAVCPLTLDHEQVVARLEQVGAAVDYRQDGTAIGDAVALAVAELQSLDKSLHLRDPAAELTRVIVLLTDGKQNAGELAPAAAARLARHYEIRVYVIGLQPNRPAEAAPGELSNPQQTDLRAVAESTGGKFFEVSDTSSLRAIYASIDALERTELTQRRIATRREWAIEWFQLGPFGLPPIATVALMTLTAEIILRRTVYGSAL